MTLKIGFDMDGVVADFGSAYRALETRLFGSAETTRAGEPGEEEERPPAASEASSSREERRRREAVWREIRSTPDFWTTLRPIQENAVRRIHEMMLANRWEVFFITQRPATAGDTAQRQTQRWLVAQGFDLPSVLVIAGSRGAAAATLRLDYHVDDLAQNCVDVLSDSRARPILIVRPGDDATARTARRLGIGVASSIDECLHILSEASMSGRDPGMIARLAALVGWR
jgi:deoxypyrimidine-specific 5' nucleotidase type C protein (NT5C)